MNVERSFFLTIPVYDCWTIIFLNPLLRSLIGPFFTVGQRSLFAVVQYIHIYIFFFFCTAQIIPTVDLWFTVVKGCARDVSYNPYRTRKKPCARAGSCHSLSENVILIVKITRFMSGTFLCPDPEISRSCNWDLTCAIDYGQSKCINS